MSIRRLMQLLVLGLCALLAPSAGPAGGQNDIPWLASWNDGLARMKSDRKPVMLYFYNEKARPCHEMETSTFADPNVVAKVGGFVPVKLLEPANRALANQHQLLKVPTVIFLDAEGRELDRAVGFKRAESFMQYLDRLNSRESDKRFETAAVNISAPSSGSSEVTLSHSAPDAAQVFLVGDFNDWREDATAMEKGADGRWTTNIQLSEGIYEYRFKMGDGLWSQDLSNPLKKPNPYGQFNSVLIVGNPKRSPQISGKAVTFIMFDPTATSIELAGSFNNWERLKLYRNPAEPGMWGVRYELPAGLHQYKYVVDNRWMSDPENYTPMDDGAGNVNSSFRIEP